MREFEAVVDEVDSENERDAPEPLFSSPAVALPFVGPSSIPVPIELDIRCPGIPCARCRLGGRRRTRAARREEARHRHSLAPRVCLALFG